MSHALAFLWFPAQDRRRSSAGAPAQKKVKVSKDVLSMLVQAAGGQVHIF
jgi:hypothetical protein